MPMVSIITYYFISAFSLILQIYSDIFLHGFFKAYLQKKGCFSTVFNVIYKGIY